MENICIYSIKACPNCAEISWEWIIWCGNCGVVVCSSCASTNTHTDGTPFDTPGRGKRYYAE